RTIVDVIFGCANQAAEDTRSMAHMASLSAGDPHTLPRTTTNPLCGSGLDAFGFSASAIKAGHAELLIAGGEHPVYYSRFVVRKVYACI
ncbi:3-oxoadipyl-CoA thiolase, partial [Klebsiella pneumoniae]|nr:3-oxoadipyl-CoA thiolase [Klebsiella pneumoniae]